MNKNNLVTCKLYGRLGNILYQIFATIAYAKHFGKKYIFPRKTLNPGIWKNYAFDFGLPVYDGDLWSDFEWNHEIKEVNHDPIGFTNLSGNVILDGYFQKYTYFIDYIDDLRKLLSIPDKTLKYTITSHHRLTDYTTLKGHHTNLSLNYYLDSIVKGFGFIQDHYDLMIFSDDIQWCKNNLLFEKRFKFKNVTFSQGNEIEDFKKMCITEHMIIANSSYSLLASILNPNEDKIIICPDESIWFGPENSHLNTDFMIPPNYIRIKTI